MEVSKNTEEIKKQVDALYEQARLLKKQLPKKHARKVLPQSMTDEEFTALIKQIKDSKLGKEKKVAFLLAYESGMRISEVRHLQKDDIDLKAKSIFVRQGKFSKDRVVPLPKTWKNWMFDFIPINKTSRSLQRAFKNAAKKANLPFKHHFHSLRHSFATHCLERGMPINQVQILMGHANIAATNVYIQANPRDALAKYNEVF